MACHGHGPPSEPNFATIISGYLHSDNDIALAGAVTDFTKPINYAWIHERADASQIASTVQSAWQAIIAAATKHTTYGQHETVHAKLVALLAKLANQGILTREEGGKEEECTTWGGRVYADLPMLGAEMREAWNFSPAVNRTGGSSHVETWPLLNAFAARLTASGTLDLRLYALWSIRDALETERDTASEEQVQLQLSMLTAAAQWFKVCGEKMRTWSEQREGFDKTPDPSWLGPLAKEAGVEETGYNNERWGFWKSRLQSFVSSGGALAGVAKEALEAMQ